MFFFTIIITIIAIDFVIVIGVTLVFEKSTRRLYCMEYYCSIQLLYLLVH